MRFSVSGSKDKEVSKPWALSAPNTTSCVHRVDEPGAILSNSCPADGFAPHVAASLSGHASWGRYRDGASGRIPAFASSSGLDFVRSRILLPTIMLGADSDLEFSRKAAGVLR